MRQAANILCLVVALSFAASAEAKTRHSIDIDAGRLGDAIIQLGQQTGISIGVSDPSVTRIEVGRLRGRMSVDQAIRRLLKEKPARAIRVNASSWRLVAALPTNSRQVRLPLPKQAKVKAAAPPASEAKLAEIIVTASKRETPLKLLPATVSVIGGDAFAAGLDSGSTAAILEKLPSVSSTHAGAGRNKLFIRGIADSGFTGPTQATVGQYFGEMRVNYNAPDPDLRLYDVRSVEVMEGPQGTLYGAGSLGGIIKANPTLPNLARTEAYAAYALSATAHGDESADGHMVANIPLVPDRIALRMLGYGAHEGGYIDDVGRKRKDVNGTDIVGGRIVVSIAPNDDWRIDLSAVGQSIAGDDAQYAHRGSPGLSRNSSLAQNFASNYWLVNMQVNGSLGAIDLTSSVGIVDHDLSENYDATRLGNVPTRFRQDNRIKLFSAEHRLSRRHEDGGGWLIGASLISSSSRLERALMPSSMPIPTPGVENRLTEWAVFGEGTVEIARDINMTLGGRLSSAKLAGSAFDVPELFDFASFRQQAKRTETTFLPSAAMAATPLENLTAFVRFQQGFRPGGLAIDGAGIRRFRNDRTSTLEGGFRFGDLGQDRFAAMGTLAYTDWRNIQADLTDIQGFPTTANIGDGHILSVEGQLSLRPTDQLSFDGAFIFSHSRLDRASAEARAFLAMDPQPTLSPFAVPNVASFSGRAAFTYRQPIADGSNLLIATSTRYVGKSRLGIGPVLGAEQGGYFQSNIGLKWERVQSDVFVNITNLFDTVGNRYALGTPFALPDAGEYTPLRPRTIMLGFNLIF